MPPKRPLFLAADRLAAYRWQAGRLSLEAEFVADAQGLEAFAGHLRRHDHSVFYLLVEAGDESYRIDTIPRVRGRDRRALIARRLDQHCHETPLRVALPLGREAEGRRDEKLLLAALTAPEQVAPWLSVLEQQGSRLAGVYSPALIAGTLAADLAGADPIQPWLLVTLTAGGLRQTFFAGGGLRFSRLARIESTDPAEIAITYTTESVNVQRYLAGQRLLPRGIPLRVLGLLHPDDFACCRHQCRDTEELHFEFSDLVAASRRYGLRTLPGDMHSDCLFMHLMLRRRLPGQFAHGRECRHYQLGQIRRALASTAVVILLACLLFAGKQQLEIRRLSLETRQAAARSRQARRQYDQVLKRLPSLPTSIAKLDALIHGYEDLSAHSASPAPMYVRISRALEQFPQIRIDRIDWRSGTRTGAPAMLSGRTPGPLQTIADVYGRLPDDLGRDRRAVRAAVEAFRTNLSRDAATEVTVLKRPFEIDSGKSLVVDGNAPPESDTGTFSLRIVHRASRSP